MKGSSSSNSGANSKDEARRRSDTSPKRGSSKSAVYESGRKSSNKQRFNPCDDDDFSVAPSMDQDVKSVVSVSFDEVYARGRKVCSSRVLTQQT